MGFARAQPILRLRIKDAKMKRRIVALVQAIAGD
jgi:hypothetical protein